MILAPTANSPAVRNPGQATGQRPTVIPDSSGNWLGFFRQRPSGSGRLAQQGELRDPVGLIGFQLGSTIFSPETCLENVPRPAASDSFELCGRDLLDRLMSKLGRLQAEKSASWGSSLPGCWTASLLEPAWSLPGPARRLLGPAWSAC